MKLIETLTTTQLTELLTGSAVGIFETLFESTDKFYSESANMCSGYYLQRSGNKTISPAYEKIKQAIENDSTITDSAETILARLIRGKYIDKWKKVYAALNLSYAMLTDYSIKETKTGTNTDTLTHDVTIQADGSTSKKEVLTHNVTVQDDGKTSVKETVTTDSNDSKDIYAFNSASPVGTDTGSEGTTETTVGNADDNTTSNTRKTTGTDTTEGSADDNTTSNTQTTTGTDTTDHDIDETYTKTGQMNFGGDMVEKELRLRKNNMNLFYNIVFADIDSVATIEIYI